VLCDRTERWISPPTRISVENGPTRHGKRSKKGRTVISENVSLDGVVQAESLAQGLTPSPVRLNRLAASCVGRTELRVTPESGLDAITVWDSGPAAAALARRVIEELATVDPTRLRCCARPECSLFFYDSSRSGTQRWHSEVPCGWRERQRRRRARTETADGGGGR
jgi:hypothetical protein